MQIDTRTFEGKRAVEEYLKEGDWLPIRVIGWINDGHQDGSRIINNHWERSAAALCRSRSIKSNGLSRRNSRRRPNKPFALHYRKRKLLNPHALKTELWNREPLSLLKIKLTLMASHHFNHMAVSLPIFSTVIPCCTQVLMSMGTPNQLNLIAQSFLQFCDFYFKLITIENNVDKYLDVAINTYDNRASFLTSDNSWGPRLQRFQSRNGGCVVSSVGLDQLVLVGYKIGI